MNQNQDKVPVTLPADTMKKPYETPEIQAIVLNQQPGLLATSGFGASRNSYGDAEEYDWE